MTDRMTQPEALARAEHLLETMPFVDGHNDMPLIIRLDKQAPGDVARFDLMTARPGRDTDLARLRKGRVSAQFFAAFVPPNEPRPATFALQQITLVRRMNALHSDVVIAGLEAADIERAKQQGRIAIFTTIENGAALENRLDALEAYYDLGVRLMTLCHNNSTDWCDSATDKPRHNGLSDFGKSVIGEMNRLGMIIDLAHVTPAVMHQVLDISKAPVVWSHSNAKHLCDHPRNVPDDVLARVRDNGGVVMATFVPDFISQKSRDWMRPLKDELNRPLPGVDLKEAVPTREQTLGNWPRGTLGEYCDHLDYLADTIGHDHVGIGSDFFGGPQGQGLEDATCYPNILAELIRRGWSDAEIEQVASANLIRLFKAVEKAAGRG